MPILINTGAGGRIRTLNPQIRSLMLYPVELRPRRDNEMNKLMVKALWEWVNECRQKCRQMVFTQSV